ncbi:MAG: class I SAM-dependent methyltransferase, partial [Candidatus Sericytochromatia bacterium]
MTNIWKDFEGNNWFNRNKSYIDNKDLSNDPIIKIIDLYDLKPDSIIDIGSSNGYRVNYIKDRVKSSINFAVDPSKEAIDDGKSKYPDINFINCLGEELNIQEKFDLVIINFVFHWVYRENLFKFLYNIDSLVKENGFLIIGDFGVDSFIKREYSHLKDNSFHTWKQQYDNIFTSSGNYLEIAKLRF